MHSTLKHSGWLCMEMKDCLPNAIGVVALSSISLSKASYKNNPVIYNRVWKQIGKHFKLGAVSFFLSIAMNSSFAPYLDKPFLNEEIFLMD